MAAQNAFDVAELGRRLASRREELRLDQDAVAERARLSRAYISRLERGIVPNPKVGDLLLVAGALNVPIIALLRPEGATPAEIRLDECTDLMQQLDGEPPEVVETVLRWWRESIAFAKLGRQS
jgi:transcriptional regulator with XRE-family HTH domain